MESSNIPGFDYVAYGEQQKAINDVMFSAYLICTTFPDIEIGDKQHVRGQLELLKGYLAKLETFELNAIQIQKKEYFQNYCKMVESKAKLDEKDDSNKSVLYFLLTLLVIAIMIVVGETTSWEQLVWLSNAD